MSDEFYMRPILSVQDVEAAITYYCDRLGFRSAWTFPEAKPIIAQVGRNGFDIILDSKSAIPKPATPSVISLSLHQPEELGTLYREFQSRGAIVVSAPVEVPWEKGLYQLQVEDIDSNILILWGQKPE